MGGGGVGGGGGGGVGGGGGGGGTGVGSAGGWVAGGCVGGGGGGGLAPGGWLVGGCGPLEGPAGELGAGPDDGSKGFAVEPGTWPMPGPVPGAIPGPGGSGGSFGPGAGEAEGSLTGAAGDGSVPGAPGRTEMGAGRSDGSRPPATPFVVIGGREPEAMARTSTSTAEAGAASLCSRPGTDIGIGAGAATSGASERAGLMSCSAPTAARASRHDAQLMACAASGASGRPAAPLASQWRNAAWESSIDRDREPRLTMGPLHWPRLPVPRALPAHPTAGDGSMAGCRVSPARRAGISASRA